jgi:hypothetical protein
MPSAMRAMRNEQLRDRPHEHAEPEHHAGAEAVEHHADRQLRERVRERERREQQAHLRGGKPQLLADRMIGDRQRAAVEIVHDSRQREERECDPLNALEARGLCLHGVSSGALSSLNGRCCLF